MTITWGRFNPLSGDRRFSTWFIDHLQFQTIRVCKEDRIISRRVVILGRRVEYIYAILPQVLKYIVHFLSPECLKCKVMETCSIAIMLHIATRLVQRNAKLMRCA